MTGKQRMPAATGDLDHRHPPSRQVREDCRATASALQPHFLSERQERVVLTVLPTEIIQPNRVDLKLLEQAVSVAANIAGRTTHDAPQ